MKTINGNLIMTEDMTFDEDLKVEGNILGKNGERFNLTVKGNLKSLDIDAKNIIALNIIAGDINAWNIDARNIKALNINALNINAWDIKAVDIKALNINASDINAKNIDAKNINAGNIIAWNIDASDIDALDISYYAMCFAYNNITCKSIKGRRENSKHFCLEGKITIKDKKSLWNLWGRVKIT
jgi:hypothetical protein